MTLPRLGAARSGMERRDWLRLSTWGLLGAGVGPWLPALADEVAQSAERPRRHVVLLWMQGGPSQTDTFDMKVGHDNGGPFQEIETAAPGLRFSEHLPQLATHARRLAVVRSLSTKEGDHGRGTFLMRTGKPPGGPLRYPAIGSSLCKALGDDSSSLPNYVSIGATPGLNPAAFSPGFLGPRFAAAPVGQSGPETPPTDAGPEGGEGDGAPRPFPRLGVDFLSPADGVDSLQAERRLEIWRSLQDGFLSRHAAANAVAQDTVYQRAVRMMQGGAREAFALEEEPDAVRERYGRTRFGQGCLLARRLIERGVPFIEVTLGSEDVGWDTHQDNFNQVRTLSQQLDAGWGSLMTELDERGLLDSTTLLWLGEFGRTPKINDNQGRDHFPQAWSCVFAGGGIQGGQAFGATNSTGEEVVDQPVDVGNVLATLCRAAGVDPHHENITPIGRPVKIVEADPIESLLS